MKKLTILVAALSLAATPAAAAYIYTPTADYETVEGNGNNVVFIPGTATRMQWFYDASIFGDAPLLINGFSFRFNDAASELSGVFTFSEAFKVMVATLDGSLSETFADNLVGAKTVMSGPQQFAYDSPEGLGQTKSFSVHFMFDTPYRYDPADGHLLVHMFAPAQGHWGTFDFVKRNWRQKRVFNIDDAYAAEGDEQTYGPVTRFDVSPIAVPEPTTWVLMILGFGAAGAALRRRRACVMA